MSAHLGTDLSLSFNSVMMEGISIFCGQALAQAPQVMQFDGFLLSGMYSMRMPGVKDGSKRKSLQQAIRVGMSKPCGHSSQQ